MAQLKRIAVFSMSSKVPQLMLSGLVDGELHVTKRESFRADIHELKSSIPSKLDKLRERGYVVVVDEVTPCFSRHGRPLRLADKGIDGRPVIVAAMETLGALKKYDAITYPDGLKPEPPQSIVNEVHSPTGEVSYRIDWEQLRPESVALLLSIYAATNDTLSDAYNVKALFKELGIQSQRESRVSSMTRIFASIDRDQLSADIFDKR